MDSWFRKGDIVRLKDIRSPEMRVFKVDIETLKNKNKESERPIHVQWFDKQDVLHRDSFNEKDLVVHKQNDFILKKMNLDSLSKISNRYNKDYSFDDDDSELDYKLSNYNSLVKALDANKKND